jgi:hypothetical protein
VATHPVAGRDRPQRALDPSVIRRWIERTCAAQSLPVHITDPRALAQLVVLLGTPARASLRRAS